MKITGGCYCGTIKYEVEGDAVFKGQCHCRECQYISGGGPNMIMGVPQTSFKYTKGTPKQFRRKDLDTPTTREFCGDCGTPLLSLSPAAPGMAILKVGGLDDPKIFGQPDAVIYTCDKQPFHVLPDGVQQFEKAPG